ncbi:DUF1441 family protein [Variovorax sp. LjRoot175]|uniref:hypothetical protein n=1 Tax=Variovorax sp. LjRoot175 TaxID=3342276 RepID=UPI003ED0BF03
MNEVNATALGHGGARPGAGRKPKSADAAPTRIQEAGTTFQEQRARHERIKADERELNLQIKRGEYVLRSAVRDAMAMCLATLAQGLRSLPDNIERRLHVAPEVAEEIEFAIDTRLAEIADSMSDFTTESVHRA